MNSKAMAGWGVVFLTGWLHCIVGAMQSGEPMTIRGLPLPALLVKLLGSGAWRHPGDRVLAQVIPFLREPVDFLASVAEMRRESSTDLVDDPHCSFFYTLRGSSHAAPIDLPWLDIELAVFVAVNREPGADIGVALDYRTSREDPRVVASDWWSGPHACLWREVAPTFSEFVALVGLKV